MSHKPVNVLFVHSSNEMYGADYILYSLIEARDPEKWVPRVIVPNDVPYNGLLTRRLSEIGVSNKSMKLAVLRRRYFTHRFPLYCLYFASSVIALIDEIRRGKIDIVHSNTTAVVPGAVAARLTGKPHVWHSHEMVVSPALVRKLTARLATKMSNVVIAVSGAVKEHMLKDAPQAQNIRILHNGIELDRFGHSTARESVREGLGFTPDDVVAGTLGRISVFKGQTYQVDAAAVAVKEQPNLRFLLVGDPFVGQEYLLTELKAKITRLGLDDKVTHVGYRSDAPDLYAAFDISVLPSILPDPFPTVVLEAMASARPVVATNWGGSCEMVSEGETGYLVPIGQPEVLAERIVRLASSPSQRAAMGAAGRARAEELFTRERMVREFWELMMSVVMESKSAH